MIKDYKKLIIEYSDEVKARRRNILDTVSDDVGDFIYYDRKHDDSLPRGVIEKAIQDGEISVREIAARFEMELNAAINKGK